MVGWRRIWPANKSSGGRSIVGHAPAGRVAARMYWPPVPDDPCAVVFHERPGAANAQGIYSISLDDTRAVGPVPRPLEDLEKLMLVSKTLRKDEVWLELPKTIPIIEDTVYVPVNLKYYTPDR